MNERGQPLKGSQPLLLRRKQLQSGQDPLHYLKLINTTLKRKSIMAIWISVQIPIRQITSDNLRQMGFKEMYEWFLTTGNLVEIFFWDEEKKIRMKVHRLIRSSVQQW